MRADNSRHVVEAARRRSQLTRAKAVQALRAMDAAGEPITFETVAREAGFSELKMIIDIVLIRVVSRPRGGSR